MSSIKRNNQSQRHPDRTGKQPIDQENHISKYKIPILTYNSHTGESNIFAFARALKNYSERELPELGSSVALRKHHLKPEPLPPQLNGNNSQIMIMKSMECLAQSVANLTKYVFQQQQVPTTTQPTSQATSEPTSEPEQLKKTKKSKKQTKEKSAPDSKISGDDQDDEDEVNQIPPPTSIQTSSRTVQHDTNALKETDDIEITEEDENYDTEPDSDEEDNVEAHEQPLDPNLPDEIKLAHYTARYENYLAHKSQYDSENSILFGIISSQLSISSKISSKDNLNIEKLIKHAMVYHYG